jgi:hypothetical protein
MSDVEEGGFLQPPPVPDWSKNFNEWHPQLMVDGPLWIESFDRWLQPRWPLLHNQGLRDPVTDPSRWDRLFALWWKELLVFLSQEPQQSPPLPSRPSEAHHVPQPSASMTAPAPRQSRRRFRNTHSRLTAAKIQETCSGGEPAAVNSITVMFPSNSPVLREDLKKKPRGSAYNNLSYASFVGLRGLRYYCRLCGATSSDWKNEKELLNHVWNTHFDT